MADFLPAVPTKLFLQSSAPGPACGAFRHAEARPWGTRRCPLCEKLVGKPQFLHARSGRRVAGLGGPGRGRAGGGGVGGDASRPRCPTRPAPPGPTPVSPGVGGPRGSAAGRERREGGGSPAAGPLWEGLEATRGGGRRRRERSRKSHDFPAYINHSLFFSTGCRLKGAVSSFSPQDRVPRGGGRGAVLPAPELHWRGLHPRGCQGSRCGEHPTPPSITTPRTCRFN